MLKHSYTKGAIVIMTIHATFQSFYKSLTAIGLIVALTACGGGGSGGSKAPTPDSTPDAFTLVAVTNALPKAEVASSAVTVSGINKATAISVVGGTYSIAGGAYTDVAGTVANGQAVTVKVTASDKTNTAVTVTLTIGGVNGQFKVTTTPDTTPDAFTFTAVKDVAPKSVNTSAAITVAGVDVAVPVTITNGEYAINGGGFTSAAGTVSNGQTVTVRATASDNVVTDVTAALTIGGVTANYKITTFADTIAPTAQILFPPPVSMTEGNTILVRGSASDDYSATVSVKVNGVEAIPKAVGDYSSWQVTVPLVVGDNKLLLTTKDSAGNEFITDPASAKVKIYQDSSSSNFPNSVNQWKFLNNLVIDQNDERNQLLTMAYEKNTSTPYLFGIDLVTGERTKINLPNLYSTAIINPVNHHYYAFDNNYLPGHVLEVDLSNPTSTFSYEVAKAESIFGVAFNSIDSMFAYVNWQGPVVTTDVTFTSSKVLNASEDLGFNSGLGLAFDKTRNRYLLTYDGGQTIFTIDAVSGARSIFSNNSVGAGAEFRPVDTESVGAPGTGYVTKILIDDMNQRAFVAEAGGTNKTGRLFSIDLVSGNRTVISDENPNNSANPLDFSADIVMERNNNYIFWANSLDNSILAIDAVTGARVVLSK
jgi:hypothetical protein